MSAMRHFTKRVRILALVTVAVMLAPVAIYAAAPSMPSVGTAVYPMVFHISGANTATKANVVKFNAPFNLRLLWATATFQAKSGTHTNSHGTSNVTVLNAGQAATNAMDINATSAGTVIEATMVAAQQNVAVNGAVTADLTLWGTSPSVTDVTLVVWVQRR
jgi:hypothetical protein